MVVRLAFVGAMRTLNEEQGAMLPQVREHRGNVRVGDRLIAPLLVLPRDDAGIGAYPNREVRLVKLGGYSRM